MKNRKALLAVLITGMGISACSTTKRISKWSNQLVQQPPLASAHVGISIMDAATQQFLYNYQGDKYFIPASNTKLLTCYAALKYLGDSLPGLRYAEDAQYIYAQPTGDPSLLAKDFTQNPVLDFFRRSNKKIWLTGNNWQEKPFGFGWAWDDYESDYMAERSPMPLYGNLVSFTGTRITPSLFRDSASNDLQQFNGLYEWHRAGNHNMFYATPARRTFSSTAIPFVTNGLQLTLNLLNHEMPGRFGIQASAPLPFTQVVHSQPTDSLLKITMHRSDNFFAEQTLLMVSNERLGIMNDARIIDTLLQTDLKDLPQRPKWVDGSGLSRYNLVSPQDLVTLLYKMKQSFNWNRITTILPTGNDGTLSGYYKKLQGAIFAKTGTLSNNIALSGYLVTKKQKTLIFSILVNNHMGNAAAIRHLVEDFLMKLYSRD